MKKILPVVQASILVLAFLSLPAFIGAPAVFEDTCAGVGLSGGPTWISCAGACDVGPCKVGQGTDAEGLYKFCGCEDPIEPSCCHLVARKIEQQEPFLDARGLCTNMNPDCADKDGLRCFLVSDQPVCKVP